MKFIKMIGVGIIATSMLSACNSNSDERPVPQRSIEDQGGRVPAEGGQMQNQQGAQSGEADQYGRLPGDEHYGHDHPPQDGEQQGQTQQGSPMQTQQTPADGEPDKYGRMPGDAHYGHDHPPQDGEQQGQTQQGSPIQTQQAPADGQPDQYGRMPGDEHYGHNHPPEDQQ